MSTEQGILKFDLTDSEARASFKKATKANDAWLAFWSMSQEIFRPARKHGYSGVLYEINEMVEQSPAVAEAIGMLEKRFFQILEEYAIELD